MTAHYCWHCHAYANMGLPQLHTQYLFERHKELANCTFPKPENMKDDDDDIFVLYQCDQCGYPNIAHYSRALLKSTQDYDSPLDWIPASVLGKDYSDIPERIASAASECHECFSIGAYRAAVIMARSVLEAIVTDKIKSPANERGKDKTLNTKLRDAANEGVISKRLGELANVIKDVGNGSTHNIFEPIGKDEADYILGFMDLLIEETYQQDERLKKLSELNRQLEQAKTEKLSSTLKGS